MKYHAGVMLSLSFNNHQKDREGQPQWHLNTSSGRTIPKPCHQNPSSGREDQENLKEGYQNTIRRTTKVQQSAIKILLAGGKTTKVQHSVIRILVAGGRPSRSAPMPSEYY
jgi:hypothetical protein